MQQSETNVAVDKKREKRTRSLVLFDRLRKESQKEKNSIWKGDRGVYVFEDTGEVAARKPIRKVYLNRSYFTGVFRSKKPNEYTGDIKGIDGKVYLVFRVSGPEELEIYERR